MPAPGEHNLALLAEFVLARGESEAELGQRVEALMTSFRWQAALAARGSPPRLRRPRSGSRSTRRR